MATQLDSLGENQFLAVRDVNHPRQDLIIDANNLASYKVYTAFLSQSKKNPPTAIILENTIGNIAWAKQSTGIYIGKLEGAFPDLYKFFTLNSKTMIDSQKSISIKWSNSNEFEIRTFSNGILEDGILDSYPIEIRVYN